MNSHCTDCPFKDLPCVGGEGSPEAQIAVVGMNPGAHEVQVGRPFVGPSGHLFDAMLGELGIEREDLWVTNAVLCHHGGDPPPRAAFEACRPRLVGELQRVDPTLIITLGADATQSLLDSDEKIGSLIGAMVKQSELDRWVIPTYHPAFILRGSIAAYDDLEEAFVRAKRIVAGTTPLPEPWPLDRIHHLGFDDETWRRLDQLYRSPDGTVLAIDTETDFVRDPNWVIHLVQISDGKDAWVFEADTLMGPNAELFRELLVSDRITWVFHNAQFDLQQLWHHWRVRPQHIADTMALGLCLTEKLEQVGLKRLVNRYLSVAHYETEIKQYLRSSKTPFGAIPRHVMVPYAGLDALYTRRLYDVLVPEVKREGNWYLYEDILVPAQQTFADLSYQGVTVDLDYVQALRDKYYPIRDEYERKMKVYAAGMGYHPRECLKDAKAGDTLNVKSPKQLKHFVNLYLKIFTTTTDQSFIDRYAAKHPFVRDLQELRKINHMLQNYTDGIADDVWPDGRVHPDYLLGGTVTGRLAIHKPALQTLPNEFATKVGDIDFGSIRKLFVASPGHRYVHADYSQLELRVVWHLTGDEALGVALSSGDFHRVTAAGFLHKDPVDVTEQDRYISKLVTFGLAYGRQAYSLIDDLKCSVQEAQGYIDGFFARFPRYAEWWHRTQEDALRTGLLTTEFGRRRRWKLITRELEQHIRNQAVNFPVQSTASDICLIAVIRLNEYLRQTSWGQVLFTVHDSIEFEIREEVLPHAIRVIREVMEHPPISSIATFPVDISVGRSMGELEKWKG